MRLPYRSRYTCTTRLHYVKCTNRAWVTNIIDKTRYTQAHYASRSFMCTHNLDLLQTALHGLPPPPPIHTRYGPGPRIQTIGISLSATFSKGSATAATGELREGLCYLKLAFFIARSCRPSPVLVSLHTEPATQTVPTWEL